MEEQEEPRNLSAAITNIADRFKQNFWGDAKSPKLPAKLDEQLSNLRSKQIEQSQATSQRRQSTIADLSNLFAASNKKIFKEGKTPVSLLTIPSATRTTVEPEIFVIK